MIFLGCFAIGLIRFASRWIKTQIELFSIHHNASLPFPALFIERYTFVSASVVYSSFGVSRIFFMSCQPKIASAVVQRIIVDMIAFLTSLKRSAELAFKNNPVHFHCLSMARAPIGVKAITAFVETRAPTKGKQVAINGIDDSSFAFCQRYLDSIKQWQLNMFRGRLGHSRQSPCLLMLRLLDAARGRLLCIYYSRNANQVKVAYLANR